jgi:hypothetical protein
MDELAPYREQLGELERRRTQSFVLCFGIAAITLSIAMLNELFHFVPKSNVLTDVSLVVFVAVVAVADFRLRWFPCPRCLKPFMRRSFSVQPWTRKCVHYGLSALDW